jgi:hypothetical protein
MIEPGEFLRSVIDPALSGLSGIMARDMASDEARVLLLAIAMQESGLEHRRQVGPNGAPLPTLARGWWQFEKGGGVAGVLAHKSSAEAAKQVCELLEIEPLGAQTVHEALAWHDHLAACFARLLLFTDTQPLPEIGDEEAAWDYYMRNWRPGKPHRDRWSGIYPQALDAVASADAITLPVAAAPTDPPKAERGVLKVAGDKPVEVILPQMARGIRTSEFWLVVFGAIADLALQLAPLIEPQLDRLADNAIPGSITIGTAFFGAVRTLYKGWRMSAAVKVASAEVAR